MKKSIKIVTVGVLMLFTINSAAFANHPHYWRKFRHSIEDVEEGIKHAGEMAGAATAVKKLADELSKLQF